MFRSKNLKGMGHQLDWTFVDIFVEESRQVFTMKNPE